MPTNGGKNWLEGTFTVPKNPGSKPALLAKKPLSSKAKRTKKNRMQAGGKDNFFLKKSASTQTTAKNEAMFTPRV
jgi:hypothetical protein